MANCEKRWHEKVDFHMRADTMLLALSTYQKAVREAPAQCAMRYAIPKRGGWLRADALSRY